MPSPFPGMNPYLEHPHVWEDFHYTFIPYARSALAVEVGPAYYVMVEQRLYLHEAEEKDRALIGVADVGVSRLPPASGPAPGPATATVSAPARVRLPRLSKKRVGYLAVYDRDGRQVVTVVELLSPSNKAAGADRENFLAKRRELLSGGVNYVEIDLLRGGRRLPLTGLPPCDYYALVSRPAERPEADVWPVHLHEPLPTVPIPLRPGDREAPLNLQAVLHRVYDEAKYARSIYGDPPHPQLSAENAAWAEAIARAATSPG